VIKKVNTVNLYIYSLFCTQCSTQYRMKKRSEETQTLRDGCSKAEPKIFAPSQTPFPGVRDGQNLISWRWSLPLPTNPVWWGSKHAISSYRGNRSTNAHTYPPPPHTHTLGALVAVVECRVCNWEVAGLNLSLGYFAPGSTQPSIPPESVNEYQL